MAGTHPRTNDQGGRVTASQLEPQVGDRPQRKGNRRRQMLAGAGQAITLFGGIWLPESVMAEPGFQPHLIKSPIQLLAVWFATLVVVDGAFVTGAATVSNPAWIAPLLAVAAVVFVPVFLVAAFVMQTRFRAFIQDDEHFADWQKRQEILFKDFKAENEVPPGGAASETQVSNESWQARELRRKKRYEDQQGLFLVHAWRPSSRRSWKDIVIWLHQHGDGPLSQGNVECVEYHLGPKFFTHPVEKRNAEEKFRLEVSAYGPMLCLARVWLKGDMNPIDLERYVDLEEPA
jgi:pYEATS domain-containing protein involved in immunity